MPTGLHKTHTCGELRRDDAGKSVTLMGWVHRRRTHGGLTFIDLRDRWGITQVVFNPTVSAEAFAVSEEARPEYVLAVQGTVNSRPAGTENPQLATGEIELVAERARVLNWAKTPPFYVNEDVEVDELLRLKYRYLDLRRLRMRDNLILRHQAIKFIRDWLSAREFIEVETPILVKETPGGAREFLVPSRVHPGHFYALPQSPQQYKQLLMVGGVERYFQIARCFRDEDLRADRQLEFTQLDLEMSFVDQDQVLALTEELMIALVQAVGGKKLGPTPFPRLTFAEAMDRYGSDKPDMRFGLLLTDVSDLVAGCEFRVFADTVAGGGRVKGIRIPGAATYTRRESDELIRFAVQHGAKGLVTLAITPDGYRSPLTKGVSSDVLDRIVGRLEGEVGDMLAFVADRREVVDQALGELRLEVGRRLGLLDKETLHFAWIVETPAFEWNAERQTYQAKHHQFTAPYDEDIPLLDDDPLRVRAKQYDLVCNGYELGGGSIRIHRRELQAKIFQVIGLDDDQANEMFGHLLEAFEFGTPPHGGIALGLDRVAMLLAGEDNIREVIAFPKTQSATEPMTGAPSRVDPRELRDLHIKALSVEPAGEST